MQVRGCPWGSVMGEGVLVRLPSPDPRPEIRYSAPKDDLRWAEAVLMAFLPIGGKRLNGRPALQNAIEDRKRLVAGVEIVAHLWPGIDLRTADQRPEPPAMLISRAMMTLRAWLSGK